MINYLELRCGVLIQAIDHKNKRSFSIPLEDGGLVPDLQAIGSPQKILVSPTKLYKLICKEDLGSIVATPDQKPNAYLNISHAHLQTAFYNLPWDPKGKTGINLIRNLDSIPDICAMFLQFYFIPKSRLFLDTYHPKPNGISPTLEEIEADPSIILGLKRS